MPQDPANILVVDDEPDILGPVKEFLEAQGYGCTATTDPSKAIELLGEETFDLVITDLKMGGLTGMDVLEAAGSSDAAGTRVVMMTAFPTVENAIEALMSGAEDYILKPFSFDALQKVVERTLEKQRLARENVSLRESLALYRASEALEAPLELPQYLEMILDVAIQDLDCGTAQLGLTEENGRGCAISQRVGRARDESRGLLLEDEELEQLCREFPGEGSSVLNRSNGSGPLLALPLRASGEMVGVIALRRGPGASEFTSAEAKAVGIIASGTAVAVQNARLYNSLQRHYLRAIRSLVAAVEAKDPYTSGHSEKVSRLAQALAREAGLEEEQVEGIRVAGLLHDAGKIGVPESILLKKGPLTEEEYEVIKGHVEISGRIVEPLGLEPHIVDAISQHHERLDGSGYPRGISEDQLSAEARILAIADTLDAMTSDRVYRSRMSLERIMDTLDRLAGRKLDADYVEMMKGLLARDGEWEDLLP
ncbi:MAG: response regulator [bacterium]